MEAAGRHLDRHIIQRGELAEALGHRQRLDAQSALGHRGRRRVGDVPRDFNHHVISMVM